MATDYGTDCDCSISLPRVHNLVSGPKNVLNAIARRWQTPFGALEAINGDATYGFDVRALLNAQQTLDLKARGEAALERQAELDERVAACSVTITFIFASSSLKIEGTLTLVEDEVFQFVASVNATDFTIDFLEG